MSTHKRNLHIYPKHIKTVTYRLANNNILILAVFTVRLKNLQAEKKKGFYML